MDPAANRPPNPVAATPYSPSGEAPRSSVHDPAREAAVVETVLLVHVWLPAVRARPVRARAGFTPSTSKEMPVRAFPCAAVLGDVVLVRTTVRTSPEMENSAVPDAVVPTSGLVPDPLKRTPARAAGAGPRRAVARTAHSAA